MKRDENCPICGGQLNVDLEYMQKRYGEDWERADTIVFYCQSCGCAGSLDELTYLASIWSNMTK